MPYRTVSSTVPCCPIVIRQHISAVLPHNHTAPQQCHVFPCAVSYRQLKSVMLSYIRYPTASSEVPRALQCGVFPCVVSYHHVSRLCRPWCISTVSSKMSRSVSIILRSGQQYIIFLFLVSYLQLKRHLKPDFYRNICCTKDGT